MTELRAEGLRSRTLIFAACLACAFVVLLGRLAYLQILKHDEYSRLAENQHAKTVPLRPKRGPILDRGGQALAVSSRADTLYVTPSKVEDAPRLAARLAPILGEPARDLVRRLTVAKKFAPVRRRLNPDMARAVRDLKDPSLALVDDSLRLYPNRELAAQLVGFEGAEGKGLAGIEQAWDAHLAGVEGRAVVERDALGREVTGAPDRAQAVRRGAGRSCSRSTPRIQYLAEKEVDAAWRRTRAKSAMAVAMDPRTGEILAMAIRPTYNPNALRRRHRRRPARPRGHRSVRARLDLQGDHGRLRPRGGRGAAHRPRLRRERRDHGGERHDPRLEEVRLAHLHRGAPELLQRGLDQGRHDAGQGALLQVHHRVRLRGSDQPGAARREPGPAPPARRSGRGSRSPPCRSGRRSR